MHASVLGVLSAVVIGGLASMAGGYLGGQTLAAKHIGAELSGFLGMLYGPAAGFAGVIAGLVVVVAVVATTQA